jgi:hypothetical protein
MDHPPRSDAYADDTSTWSNWSQGVLYWTRLLGDVGCLRGAQFEASLGIKVCQQNGRGLITKKIALVAPHHRYIVLGPLMITASPDSSMP